MGFLHWLSECDTPLSIHSHNLPDSATLREQNDSNPDPTYQDCWPSERYKSDEPERAVGTTESSTFCADQCPDCRSAPNMPHAPGCDEAAKVTDAVINAAPEHWYREHPWIRGGMPLDVKVESCPECGSVTDLDYGPESVLLPERESGAEEETLSVPFPVQEFMFESLVECELDKLHDLIDDHHDLILEMARDRFHKGYAKFGSEMYSWTPERRLDETLQEVADSVVYPTSGPMRQRVPKPRLGTRIRYS